MLKTKNSNSTSIPLQRDTSLVPHSAAKSVATKVRRPRKRVGCVWSLLDSQFSPSAPISNANRDNHRVILFCTQISHGQYNGCLPAAWHRGRLFGTANKIIQGTNITIGVGEIDGRHSTVPITGFPLPRVPQTPTSTAFVTVRTG